MHLDTSYIIADPDRENKFFYKYKTERLVCIREVAAEVRRIYMSLTKSNNKSIPADIKRKMIKNAMNGIEVISLPDEIEMATEILWKVLISVGHAESHLKDNEVDILVCGTLLLDEEDDKLGADARLITEISHIFSNDIVLLPRRTPLTKNRAKHINHGLRKHFWQDMPLDFCDIATRNY